MNPEQLDLRLPPHPFARRERLKLAGISDDERRARHAATMRNWRERKLREAREKARREAQELRDADIAAVYACERAGELISKFRKGFGPQG